MNKILTLAAFASLYACSSHDNTDLGKLMHERDSLKEVHSDVEDKIKTLDEQIAKLDTTIKKRLVLVTTQKLQKQKFEHYFDAHGVVESERNVTLNAEMGGLVRQINIEEGATVSEGEVLIVLDTDVIQKSIDELETAYELAKTVFARQESLWKQNIGSEIQYLEAKNRRDGLEQKLKTLKAQKDMSVIRAPFSGVVDDIMVKQGEMANPMFPVVRLVNLSSVYINADISESYIGKVKQGSEVKVNFPSLGEERMYKVNRTGNFINPNNRTFKIRIEIENKDQALKPNLLAVLNIRDFEADSAIVLPSMAIQQDANGNDFVFIAESNSSQVAKKIKVKSGKSYMGKTMITEGLEGDEEVILDGARSIKDGEFIEVASPPSPLPNRGE